MYFFIKRFRIFGYLDESYIIKIRSFEKIIGVTYFVIDTKSSLRLVVRTLPFHGGDVSSNLTGGKITIYVE